MGTLAKRNRNDGQRGLMRPWFQDFFDVESFFGRDFPQLSKSLPAVNISEDEKCFAIEVAAPGYKREDFKINVEDNILTINAESKHESTEEQSNKQYNRREYSYSSFTRSFQLPDNVKEDGVAATYTDGILKLELPKTEQKSKPGKQIEVK
jgi:HSP20 family protein